MSPFRAWRSDPGYREVRVNMNHSRVQPGSRWSIPGRGWTARGLSPLVIVNDPQRGLPTNDHEPGAAPPAVVSGRPPAGVEPYLAVVIEMNGRDHQLSAGRRASPGASSYDTRHRLEECRTDRTESHISRRKMV